MQQDQEMTQDELCKFHIQRCSKQQEINRLEQKSRSQLKSQTKKDSGQELKKDACKAFKKDLKNVALCALLSIITVFAIWGIN